MSEVKTSNAIIEAATISCGERGLLTAWLTLDYGGAGQAFGGYALYLPQSFSHHEDSKLGPNFGGHFIMRCMEVAGVEEWSKLPGKTVRVRHEWTKVHAIGHIVKDDWFCPSDDFEQMNRNPPQPRDLSSVRGSQETDDEERTPTR